jgi:hypothetical protein
MRTSHRGCRLLVPPTARSRRPAWRGALSVSVFKRALTAGRECRCASLRTGEQARRARKNKTHRLDASAGQKRTGPLAERAAEAREKQRDRPRASCRRNRRGAKRATHQCGPPRPMRHCEGTEGEERRESHHHHPTKQSNQHHPTTTPAQEPPGADASRAGLEAGKGGSPCAAPSQGAA